MYRAYLEIGQTVKEWCENNYINTKTLYYRLKRLREEALRQEQHELALVREGVKE